LQKHSQAQPNRTEDPFTVFSFPATSSPLQESLPPLQSFNKEMSSIMELVPPGVITGKDVLTLFEHARTNGYALPAVNCTR
jgi:hypothetical protein